MRGDQTPLTRFLHPDVGKAVVIVVRPLTINAFFVIDAGDDGCVAVHANSQLRDLYEFYTGRSAGAVGKVAGLAVGTAVFKGDDEIIVKNGGEHCHFMMLVTVEELEFQSSNRGRVGRLLRS